MKLDKLKFATLIAYIQSCDDSYLEPYQIEKIDSLIDINAAPDRIYPKISDIEYLLVAIKFGRKIEAMKAYRSLTGFGLKESKDMIEKHWPTVSIPYVEGTIAELLNRS